MSDGDGAVYWIFVVARSSDASPGEASPPRGLDLLAIRTAAGAVVDGVCNLRRIVSSSCCFCSSSVIVAQRGTP
jgi:hypothetical protein